MAENSRAGFQIIAVDGTGKRIALSGLSYSWVREDISYQWFQSNGEWRFQRTGQPAQRGDHRLKGFLVSSRRPRDFMQGVPGVALVPGTEPEPAGESGAEVEDRRRPVSLF